MLRINLGDIGSALFSSDTNGNLLQIDTGSTLNIIRDYAVLRPDLGMNLLQLHKPVQVARGENVFKWAKFRAAQNVVRKRDNSCTWNPRGGHKLGTEEADVCNKQHQTEFCVGEIWDTCWEKLLGVGNDIERIDATSEGSIFLNILISKEMETIGNDYYDLYYFANHPNVELSEQEGYWQANAVNATEWNNFKTKLTDDRCGGVLTLLESLRGDGIHSHLNVEIDDADIDGELFIGDTFELFRKVLRARTATFQVWSRDRYFKPYIRPVINVSPSIYNRYKEQLLQQFPHIPESYYLFTQGEGGIKMPMPDLLQFDGYWILSRPDWGVLDKWTGITSHIVLMQAPEVLGLGYDVPPTKQYKGMGLIVNSWNAAPMLGKTYFHTNYKLGAAILDTDYVVYASKYVVPENV